MFEHERRGSETFPQNAIAIVGMAGRFPDAPNLEKFWDNIRNGVESLRSYSAEEITAAGVPHAVQQDPNFVARGTTLDQTDMFDAEFFQMSPGEAQVMDPQQRLFLECAWEALEHAGYAPGNIDVPVGVYAGVSMNTYLLAHILANRQATETAGGYQLMLGNDKDFLCTHASYKLDLKGPSVTVQTACSTSLVAVEMACRALARGECDLAMAGGSSITFPERAGYLYQEGMIFSPDGHCRPFDVEAKGTRAGAGAGLVVLKRLRDAVRDGDTIHAVIRGAAVNNDGGDKAGYTAPSINGQAEVIAMAQTIAEVSPRSIGYVEAHGTGTPLGDPIEIAALTQVFRDTTDDVGFCRLGALKANIGHLDAAAGVAGLIKTVLCLKNKWIPPLVNFSAPNPQLSLETSPFLASADGSSWQDSEGPRRAAISSFGIGGTNAHLILEEAPAHVAETSDAGPQTLVLSARSQTALTESAANLADALEAETAPVLSDVAHTLLQGRSSFRHRRFVVVEDLKEAAQELRRASRGTLHDGGNRRVAFMFSGQGSQHAGMGYGLYELNPNYREAFDTCAEILAEPLGLDLRTAVSPEGTAPLSETWLTQPALFATEYALARMWAGRGVEPAAMIGHSLGEYVAAHLAGVMSLEVALKLVTLRGQLMQELLPGSMASVPMAERDLRRRLAGRVEIAAENAPELSVISGETDAVNEVIAELKQDGIGARLLHTSHAFHSRMTEPVLDRFAEALADIDLSEPAIPYVSNVTGAWITPQEAVSPDYYVRHLRRSVRFSKGVQLLGNDPSLFLLEVGPGSVLSSLAQEALPASRNRISPTLAHPNENKSDAKALLEANGRLWAAGVPIAQTGIANDQTQRPRRVALPTYPFERQRHWVDPAGDSALPTQATQQFGFETGRALDPFLTVPNWSTAKSGLPLGGLSGRWLIFVDAFETAERLEQKLSDAGAESVIPILPTGASQTGSMATARPGHPEDIFAAISDDDVPIEGIVTAWGLQGSVVNARQVFDTMVALSHFAQSAPLASSVKVLCLTAGAFSVLDERVHDPENTLPLGPLLALTSEEPKYRFRLIDIAPDDLIDPTELTDVILDEALKDDPELVCARRRGLRFHRRYDPVKSPKRDGSPLKENGVCLITGGLGGVGLAVARALAQEGPARFVLVGRTPLPERDEWEKAIETGHPKSGAISEVKALEALGSEVLIAACDVSDSDNLQQLRQQVIDRWGEVNAIIHAAGLPGTGALTVLQTPEDMSATLSAKVTGTRALAKAFGEDPLDFVVLMSSINSVISAAGAADYAAANAFLDSWPNSDERPETWSQITVMNWDAWAEVGMAARRLQAHPDPNLIPIDLDAALQTFLDFADSPVARVVISTFDLSAMELFARRAIVVAGTDPQHQMEALSEPSTSSETNLVRREHFDSQMEFAVAEIWADLLQIPLSGPDDDFLELGGHSLMATRFLARLDAATSVKLTLSDVFDARTVGKIAALATAADEADVASDSGGEDTEEFVL